MKTILSRFVLLTVLLCSWVATAAETGTIPVTDAMPSFWKFWDMAQDKSSQQQVQLFREIVVSAHPELFQKGVLPLNDVPDAERYKAFDRSVAQFLSEVRPFIPA